MCLSFLGTFLVYEGEGVRELIGTLKMMHHDASHQDVMHHDADGFWKYVE